MNVRYTEDLLTTAGSITAATQVLTDNRTGFTVGVGVEFGLVENLSGKIEYDFYDFGGKTYNFNTITPVNVNSALHSLASITGSIGRVVPSLSQQALASKP